MRCGVGRCPGAKSTGFSKIPVVSFSLVHAITSRLNVILLIYRQAAVYLPCQHNTLDIKENIQHVLELRKTHKRFGGGGGCVGDLGDNDELHCIDCRLVSGSYVNTQVSSQVIIKFNKSCSF